MWEDLWADFSFKSHSHCVFSHPEHQEYRTKTSNVVAIQILMEPAVSACVGGGVNFMELDEG